VRVQAEPSDVQDVIGSALEQLEARKEDHPINVNISPELRLYHGLRFDLAGSCKRD